MNNQKTLLGAHVSIAGGLQKAIEEAIELECTAIQIFTRNNRRWAFDHLSTEEIEAFLNAKKKSPVRAVISHASYLINLGSTKVDVRKKSIEALEAELYRCHQIKIPYVVLHPGTCAETQEIDCINHIATTLSIVLNNTPSDVSILLENTAGQGSSIGYKLEQLANIRAAVTHKNRLGFCFDTCHGFAAGYDLRTSEKYIAFWGLFDQILGIKNLKALHLNDSKKDLNSHVDRHENIGKGKIGIDTFNLIMRDTKLAPIPKIIETPMETLSDHAKNLAILKNLTKK